MNIFFERHISQGIGASEAALHTQQGLRTVFKSPETTTKCQCGQQCSHGLIPKTHHLKKTVVENK